MKSDVMWTFDCPEYLSDLVEEYFLSLDFSEANWKEQLGALNDCTALELLDTSGWNFSLAGTDGTAWDERLWSWNEESRKANFGDEVWDPIVKRLAREQIGEFKDVENLVVKRAATFCYPKEEGFMGWHTNDDTPAWRIYFTYTEEENKSYISYYNEETQEEMKSYDKKGVTCRVFNLLNGLRHSVYAQTRRWTMGFRIFDGDKLPEFFSECYGEFEEG